MLHDQNKYLEKVPDHTSDVNPSEVSKKIELVTV